MGAEKLQNRVSYVKCSPDGELPGNEKPPPRMRKWYAGLDLRYGSAPVAAIELCSRIVRGSPRFAGSAFFRNDTGFLCLERTIV